MKIARVSNAIILNSNNEVLIAQKSTTKRFNPSSWTTPAGHIEEGETPEEAVIRETKEEVDLDVTIITKLGVFKRDSPEIPDKQIHNHFFLCRTENVDITLQVEEFQKFEWIALDQIQADERLATKLKKMCVVAQSHL